MFSVKVLTKIELTDPVALEVEPEIATFCLSDPTTFSTLSKLDPLLHSETTDLETSVLPIFWMTVSPFWKSPLKFFSATTYLLENVDETVLSKWNAPPFLIILMLCGTPIVSLSTYASTSPSTISITGA